ncbi:MAG: preprotein translocase subunit SecA [Neisseriaceae bacterium]|nr:MAG: preprotein translocase subunit SecA [Neisseriaceae bacterium]
MIKKVIYKIFGTRNERLIKQYLKTVVKINALESQVSGLNNEELQAKTQEFRDRYAKGETLDQLLPEVFAVCREASKRVLNMRHFDVQLIGGMVLNDNKIAEMRTGEGKTLVGSLPAYLNTISGNGVHIVTVNDYLAKRDAEVMRPLFEFLGLTVGINLPDIGNEAKSEAYACDITYGTNNEFGFDYLRDNMVFESSQKVQRKLAFAIVDEVDSILIDEARTPLIISGPAEGNDALYRALNTVPPMLTAQEEEESETGDFWVDEKHHNVILSEAGHEKIEQILLDMGLLKEGDSLYNAHNISLMHHLIAAMRAHYVYFKDQHYVVQNGEVVIVDEFTGRLMSGRRWSDGLHQAVEAKEGVTIQRENQTLASITFQNYFRLYGKLSGMTGTADTEAYEFQQIYGLETVVIPTNKPLKRLDHNDKIYMNIEDKFNAIVEDLKECTVRNQPALVGTTSVEASEMLSNLLTKAGLKHSVLNAKQHAREADIIVQAGAPGAITVATNMAGRGTDIILGGNPKPLIDEVNASDTLSEQDKLAKIEQIMLDWQGRNKQVLDAGGLYIIGTERHESRRIDNQLRGRSGRQGDVGASRFYLSLDDSLLRIFGGERMRGMMQRLGMEKGEAIEHKLLSRSIESAQRKVEGHNFDIRKQLLDYDDVANDQRKVIYEQRNEILNFTDLSPISSNMIQGIIGELFDTYIPPKSMEDAWDIAGLDKVLKDEYFIDFNVSEKIKANPSFDENELRQELVDFALNHYQAKLQGFTERVNLEVNGFIDSVLPENKDNWNLSALDGFISQNGATCEFEFADEFTNESNKEDVLDSLQPIIKQVVESQVVKFERGVLLQHLDHYWREHLTQLEQLRQGIGLRGYAQKDPKQEYKKESFELFSMMLDGLKRDVVKVLFTVKLQSIDDVPNDEEMFDDANVQNANVNHQQPNSLLQDNTSASGEKLNRNAPCYCGSGKKYKHCHGKLS